MGVQLTEASMLERHVSAAYLSDTYSLILEMLICSTALVGRTRSTHWQMERADSVVQKVQPKEKMSLV